MKKRNIIITLYVIAGILCITAGISSLYLFAFENKPVNTEVKEKKKVKTKEKKDIYISPVPGLINAYNNSDIVSELTIPSIDFETPVAKANDNEYYLQHSFNKEDSKLGAIFVDYRTNDIDTAKQINIYGHNSDYYTLPFKILENYQDENYFNTNKDIYLNTSKQSLHYKVFASKIITTEDEHMAINYGNYDNFLEHVSLMRENALFDTGENIKKEDKLLILQTCLYNPEGRKILVLAKLIKDKK